MGIIHFHRTITPVSWAKSHDYNIRSHGYSSCPRKIMIIAKAIKPLFSLPCYHYYHYYLFAPFLPPLLPLLPPMSSPNKALKHERPYKRWEYGVNTPFMRSFIEAVTGVESGLCTRVAPSGSVTLWNWWKAHRCHCISMAWYITVMEFQSMRSV